MPIRFPVLELLGDPGRLRAEINWLQVQLGPREARKLHQVIDQLRHLITGGDDPLGVTAAFLVENLPVVFQQGPAVAAERPQRGTQVVGNRVDETLQILIRTAGVLHPKPGGYVPDGRGDENALVGVDRGQGDLGREGAGIAATPGEGQARAHRPVPRVSDVPGPVRRVDGAGGLGDQDLDRLADELLPLVAEQPFRLGVDQDDPAVGGYAHHRVGRRLQERDEYAIGERGRLRHNLYCSSDLR